MANINEKKQFHFIYKTTNLKNDKYYIGMHSTSNMKDGYLGSGKRLRYSIQKHGIDCFKCEILEFLPDRLSLAARERELITEEMIHDMKCMNIQPGGGGGFNNKEHMMKCSKAGNVGFKKKLQDENFKKSFSEICSNNMQKRIIEGTFKTWKETCNWVGRKQSDTHKARFKESIQGKQKGELNSQFGTFWITNGTENKKIKKEQPVPYGWHSGRIVIANGTIGKNQYTKNL